MHIVLVFLNNPLKCKNHLQLKGGTKAGSVGHSLLTCSGIPTCIVKDHHPSHAGWVLDMYPIHVLGFVLVRDFA